MPETSCWCIINKKETNLNLIYMTKYHCHMWAGKMMRNTVMYNIMHHSEINVSLWSYQTTYHKQQCQNRYHRWNCENKENTNIKIFSIISLYMVSLIIIMHWWRWWLVNSLWPSDTIQRHKSGSTLAQVPDGTKPLPEPMLTYLQCLQWHSVEGNLTRDSSPINH